MVHAKELKPHLGPDHLADLAVEELTVGLGPGVGNGAMYCRLRTDVGAIPLGTVEMSARM